MRRSAGWWTVLAIAIAAPAFAETRTSVNIQIGIGSAPPPPVVVYRAEPPMVVVPGSAVYVVNDSRSDYDFFRCGVYWYIWNEGYWYRANNYRGPFAAVDAKYVPSVIMTVPARRWKHHPHGGPPGQMRKREAMVAEREHEHESKHGRHRGDD